MDENFETCLQRVQWANKHIATLELEVRRFIEADAYLVDPQMDWGNGEVVVFAEPLKDPPQPLLGFVIGDVVNALRAGLDGLVWALTLQTKGPAPANPIPFESPWRRVRFPILIDPAKWPKAATKNLWGITDPALVARFKRLQPFYRRKRHPKRHELWILDELWSIDKHRHPHLAHAFIGLHSLGPNIWPFPNVEPPPAFQGYNLEIVKQRRIGPLKGRTELGRVRQGPPKLPGGIIATTLPQVHVNPVLAFDIAFDKGPPAHSGRVVDTLKHLSDAVLAVLVKFEAEFR